MSQKSLEIVGEEWIAPSLVESKYSGLIHSEAPILSAGSIDSVGSIDSEKIIGSAGSIESGNDIESEEIIGSDFLNLEYSPDLEYDPNLAYSIDSEYSEFGSYSIDSENLIFPEDSIAHQERDIDPLTGRVRGGGPWGGPFPNNGSQVTALKDARLNIGMDLWYWNRMYVTATVKVELSSSDINSGGLRLQSSLWGIDNTIFDRRDDNILYFPDQYISQSGTYTFTTVVGRGQLDEDRWWFDQRDEIQASISLVSNSSPDPFKRRITTNIFTDWF
jgi:hypothetical protein